MTRKLALKKDTLASLDRAQLAAVAAGAQTLQSGCQSGVRACWPTEDCITPVSFLDCLSDGICG